MKILLVEDDQSLVLAIAYRLRKENFDVTTSVDGLSALSTLEAESFDIILLDRMLPRMDGVSLLKWLRATQNKTPVLMLTAMDAISDRVVGLDAGADDYLVKPFAMDELLARIRALTRRQDQWTPTDLLSANDLRLDVQRMTLTRKEQSVVLSRREGALLAFLMRNYGQILPRSVIIDRVWSDTFVEEGNLDIYIHFLRKRLSEIHSQCVIRTIRGIGYQLSDK